jgi:protein-S-isoprenylcysteine O-methyltransferase Ste14
VNRAGGYSDAGRNELLERDHELRASLYGIEAVAVALSNRTGVDSEGPRRSGLLIEWALPSFLFALLALSNGLRLVHERQPLRVAYSLLGALMWMGLFLAVQRRPPAVARERAPLAVGAALAASVVTIPIGAAGASTSVIRLSIAIVLITIGWVVSVWSLAVLGRSFGVLADARSFVARGPYRLVRHPLYLGELINLAGLVVGSKRWVLPCVAWSVLVGVQLVRAVYEERVLDAAFPEYGQYRQRVRARIVPGVG